MNDMNPSPEFEEKVRQAVDVPHADPEFVNRLRNELVRGPVKMKSRFMLKPAWAVAFILVLAILALSIPGVVAALGRLFGYVPNVGLVENTGNLRMLAEPVSVTREGVTVTISSVFVYEDHVELTYEVAGVKENYSVSPDMCGSVHPDNNFWSDSDADLRLRDGTIVRRDYAGQFQSVNQYAMKPVYAVQVPANISKLTMVLKCIPFTRLGEVPENWEVPFKLTDVPAGTIVGMPVIEVPPTAVQPNAQPTVENSNIPAPVVTMTFERIVPMDSATVIYLSMDMENHDPSLVSIMPRNVYIIDSQGQKTQLMGNFALQPFDHRVGSAFEFVSQTKPADGPLTILVENAVAYYSPLHVDPPQTTPEEMSFTFDAGDNPQPGQTWELNKTFDIAGYPLKITSAKAVTWDDVKTPDFIDGSQGYDYGYQFAAESDPSVKMSTEMDIMSESPICGMRVGAPIFPEGSSLLYTNLCKHKFPNGQVKVTIWEFSVLMENSWQVTWTP